jgi:galactose mutarotase-like enzyme
MPHVTRTPASGSVPFELVTLADERSDCAVTVAPSRGALVTSFLARGKELLYLDPTTLVDTSKSVRGGVPVLFPSPGRLDGDAFSAKGHRFGMKQHGFARTLAWTVFAVHDTPPSVVLTLESNDETRSQYPYDFLLTFTFSLLGNALEITQSVENRSREAMPFALGFHPYFLVKDKALARIETPATRALDNTVKREVPFTGFDFTKGEVDLHLEDHGSSSAALDRGDGTRIEVHGSDEFWRWVIWTLPGKEFVCLEPWTAAGNALNSGDRLLHVDPGARYETYIEIAAG